MNSEGVLLYRPAGGLSEVKPHGLQDSKFYTVHCLLWLQNTQPPQQPALWESPGMLTTQLITQKCLPLPSIFLPLEEGLYQFPENLLPSKRMEKLHPQVPQAELCPLWTPKGC